MRHKPFYLACLCVAGSLVLVQCQNSESKKTADARIPKSNYGGFDSPQQWGEHLVNAAGCNDCHSPKKMTAQGPVIDSTLLLSGHPAQMPDPDVDRKVLESKGVAATNDLTAWVGPWGISYSANLTSDSSGIGTWSEGQFIYAIRNGKYKGMPNSRPLLPPMPWQSFANFSDDELKAIFAYLKSTPPIKNVVPGPKPPVTAMH